MSKQPVIAISAGDPNGIGPEVTLKAVLGRRWPAGTRFVIIGSQTQLTAEAAKRGFGKLHSWIPAEGTPRYKAVVYDPQPMIGFKGSWGKIDAKAGWASFNWVRTGIQLCQAGTCHALVTAPICKASWQSAGISYPGHTELLADDTKTRNFAMLLMGPELRVLTVTRHIALREVAQRLTTKDIYNSIMIMDKALPWLGFRTRRIGVCALNPHAGEEGNMGDEESRLIAPAINKALKQKVRVEGPVPSDVIFHYALKGKYDGILSMYHDQGLGPLKMLSFDEGVNITLGLPMVRVSPDHGTAFNIAGKNKANASSMVEALRWAITLAGKKNPWAR